MTVGPQLHDDERQPALARHCTRLLFFQMLEKLDRVRSHMQTRFNRNSPLSGNSTGNFVISGFFEQNALE
jgi:hypothetical protein